MDTSFGQYEQIMYSTLNYIWSAHFLGLYQTTQSLRLVLSWSESAVPGCGRAGGPCVRRLRPVRLFGPKCWTSKTEVGQYIFGSAKRCLGKKWKTMRVKGAPDQYHKYKPYWNTSKRDLLCGGTPPDSHCTWEYTAFIQRCSTVPHRHQPYIFIC